MVKSRSSGSRRIQIQPATDELNDLEYLSDHVSSSVKWEY